MRKKKFYYCFSMCRSIVSLESAKQALLSDKIHEIRITLHHRPKTASYDAFFRGDGGTDMIVCIEPLFNNKHTGNIDIALSTYPPKSTYYSRIIISVSPIRLSEYFDNYNELINAIR